ncbi:MAG: glycosyltransferase family 39 protein [bacterium]
MTRRLVGVLVVSGLLKVTLALLFANLPPRFDEAEFLDFGSRVAGGAAPVPWRAPGYQWLVALGLHLGGGSAGGVRVLQALLSVLTTWVVWRTGRRLFGERAAFAAAAFVAFYPPLVAFSHLLWTETLYVALLVAAFDRALAADQTEGRGAALASGALFGAASLVRSTGLVLLAVTLGWWLVRRGRRGLVAAALLAATAAAVVVPWSLHASARSGRLVVVDTNAGFNLWSGNDEYVPADLQGIWSVGLPLENGAEDGLGDALRAKGRDPGLARFFPHDAWRSQVPARLASAGIHDLSSPAADAWFRGEALREIRAKPATFLARVPRRLAAFWSLDYFLPRHLLRDWYGAVPSSLAILLVMLTWAASAVALWLGPAALLSLGRSSFRSLTLAWLAATLVLHGVTFGVSRMHEPLVPFLALAAAAHLFMEERGERPRLRPLGVAAFGLAACAWIAALPVVVGLYTAPGPRHLGVARALGAVRHLPLPGARWAAWMTAEDEAACGNDAAAARILDEPKHAGDPWSLYLRALVTPEPDRARTFVAAALARDPFLEPARLLQRSLAERSP